MDKPKVKPFSSSITDSINYSNNNTHPATSQPMMLPAASGPVQVQGSGAGSEPSSLKINGSVSESVTSKISYLVAKKKDSTASNDPPSCHHASKMPKLEVAGSLDVLSELESELEQGVVPGSPSASLCKHTHSTS